MRARLVVRGSFAAAVLVGSALVPVAESPWRTASIHAQDEGGGGGNGGGGEGSNLNRNGSGMGSMPATMTPYEQLADKLKLDRKTQAPEAEKILADAAAEAAPLGQDMLQIRQRLINANLKNLADEVKTQTAAYQSAATKMAAVEAGAFAKIYALLKPNQQAKAPEAFAAIAGMFIPTSPAGGRRGGGRPGGGGR